MHMHLMVRLEWYGGTQINDIMVFTCRQMFCPKIGMQEL